MKIRAAMLLVILLLAGPAHAATVGHWKCRLWPTSEDCRAPVPEPVQVPVVVPAPLPPPVPAVAPPPAPAPPVAAPAPVVVPAVALAKPPAAKPVRKARPKFKTKARKRVAVASWCSRVPGWATMATIEKWAPKFDVIMTPENRALAQACLNSKRRPK